MIRLRVILRDQNVAALAPQPIRQIDPLLGNGPFVPKDRVSIAIPLGLENAVFKANLNHEC